MRFYSSETVKLIPYVGLVDLDKSTEAENFGYSAIEKRSKLKIPFDLQWHRGQ